MADGYTTHTQFAEVLREEQLPLDNEAIDKWAKRLVNLAHKLERLNLVACNYGLTEEQEKERERIEANVQKFVDLTGIKVRINTDPRGYSLYFHFPSERYNSWGGKENGWGIS